MIDCGWPKLFSGRTRPGLIEARTSRRTSGPSSTNFWGGPATASLKHDEPLPAPRIAPDFRGGPAPASLKQEARLGVPAAPEGIFGADPLRPH